jgi:hypothetical protein
MMLPAIQKLPFQTAHRLRRPHHTALVALAQICRPSTVLRRMFLFRASAHIFSTNRNLHQRFFSRLFVIHVHAAILFRFFLSSTTFQNFGPTLAPKDDLSHI